MTKVARVCESIVAGIESGSLRDGDRLPSETELASGLGVSVGTVQKALAQLATTGIVSREHGRGTFVSGSRIGPADVNYLRFRDAGGRDLPHFVQQGLNPGDALELVNARGIMPHRPVDVLAQRAQVAAMPGSLRIVRLGVEDKA
jgi:DNA-binding transcriptional regulator YhcF (GntR family)